MSNAAPRKFTVLALALIQPFASLFHDITGRGQRVADFAGDGDTVLKAAGYAFTIWGAIYAACMAYGVYQAWPRKPGKAPLAARLGWPAALAFACCTAWVIAAELDLKWLTMAIIAIGAAGLILPLLSLGRAGRAAQGRERWLVLWPLGALAGWLTIAGAVNLVTVLTATDSFPANLSPQIWALVILAAAAAAALIVVVRTGLAPFALTFGWGLAAVAAAEWQRHPMLAWAALASIALLAVILWAGARRAPIFR